METDSKAAVEGIYDVAVSASAADSAVVSVVVEVLKQQGIRVFDWTTDSNKLWGQPIAQAIEQLLTNQVGSVAVFLSNAYSSSPWCQQEIELIGRLRQVGSDAPSILPVRLDKSDVPSSLRELVWLDATALSPTEVGDKLVATVRANVAATKRIDRGLDDEALAQKAISERNPETFALLAQRLVPLGYSFARSRGVSADDAEEIVNDALLSLFTQSHQVDLSDASIRHYFLFAIQRRCVDAFRRKALRPRNAGPDELEQVVSPATPKEEPSSESLNALRRAMELLAPREREVLALMLVREMSSSDIADHLGVTRATAHVLMSRTLSHLRSLMNSAKDSHEG